MRSISVLINCYNYGAYVADAIESVLAQTLPPTEIIVVNDGSTDNTKAVLEEKFGNHSLVQIINQRNNGHVAAMVAAMERATGDLIFILDADDRYRPDHLESVVRVYDAQPDVDFVFTAHQCFGTSNDVIRHFPTSRNLGFTMLPVWFDRLWIGSITSTLTLRRNLLLTLLPVLQQVAPRWRMKADDTLNFGSSLAGAKKYFLAEPTVLYRQHGRNDHLLKRSADDYYAHTLRVESYVGVLSTHLGIHPDFVFHPEIEFRTIEYPTLTHYRSYISYIWKLRIPLTAKIKMRVLLFLYYRDLYSYFKKKPAGRPASAVAATPQSETCSPPHPSAFPAQPAPKV